MSSNSTNTSKMFISDENEFVILKCTLDSKLLPSTHFLKIGKIVD